MPAAVVTEIGPGTVTIGTLALSRVGETTVNREVATAPNLTLLAPHRYVPLIVTRLPAIPDPGENEPTVGAMCGVTV